MKDHSKIPILNDDGAAQHLKNRIFPNISLPNQEGNLLQLDRYDTFRMVMYFFPKTGRPDRPLPKNWNSILGAKGCTIQNCSFRDNLTVIFTLYLYVLYHNLANSPRLISIPIYPQVNIRFYFWRNY